MEQESGDEQNAGRARHSRPTSVREDRGRRLIAAALFATILGFVFAVSTSGSWKPPYAPLIIYLCLGIIFSGSGAVLAVRGLRLVADGSPFMWFGLAVMVVSGGICLSLCLFVLGICSVGALGYILRVPPGYR